MTYGASLDIPSFQPEPPLALVEATGGVAAGPAGRQTQFAWPPRTDLAVRLRSKRRAFQVALGLLWLLDAALQYQPYMFSTKFVPQIIIPASQGNPIWIATTQHWAARLMAQHIVVANTVFATIQLLLAALILWRPTVKIGLTASMAWAAGVWWFGEGLGGVLAGTSPLAGAPGAVILYALLALLVWPDPNGEHSAHVARSGVFRGHLFRLAWLALWACCSYLLLLPANRAAGSLHDLFTGMAAGEPGWLASLDRHLASGLAGGGLTISVVLAACCALVAVSVLAPAITKPGLVLAIILGLPFWLAENFGTILTGRGTDPNSGPLLVLMALAFWPCKLARPDVDRLATMVRRQRRRPASSQRGPSQPADPAPTHLLTLRRAGGRPHHLAS